MPRKLNKRRLKKRFAQLPYFERPPEIEKIRKEAANALRKKIKEGKSIALPPGCTQHVITIPLSAVSASEPDAAPPEPDVQLPDIEPENYTDEHSDMLDDLQYYELACGDKMINIKPANLWLAEQALVPAPQKLFGNLWLEGELCLMFADTNMGKSLLAVQIGDSISRRAAIPPFEIEAAPSPVLYLDFELSAKQFELRYRDGIGTHQFSPEFYRAEVNMQKTMPDRYETFDDYMQDTLDWAIRNTLPKILIIDNITCLSEGSHQAAGTAVTLMKSLKKLQDKNKLSILVLAHTPKRSPAKPIGRDDMGGSKMLMNFADSAFAIGQSYNEAHLRYLKQVKQRSGSQQYGEDNICLMKLNRHNGFLQYEFCGNGPEHEHLHRRAKLRTQNAALAFKLQKEGLSQRQIAAQLCLSASTVNEMLKEPAGVCGD